VGHHKNTKEVKSMTDENGYGVNETFRWEDNLKIKSAQELLAITDPEKAQEAMLQWAERYSDREISRLWETRELIVSKLRISWVPHPA
jgi:hypothetical protein